MTADINRRLENLIRFGLIADVNYSQAKARVKCGEILTDFLPFATLRTGTAQTWSPPTVGEQCIVLAMSGELTTACILTGLYTQNAPSQSPDEHCFAFPDGAIIKYNHSTGVLDVTGIQTGNVNASSSLNVECPTVNIKGNVNIQGNVQIAGSIATTGGGGNMTVSGTIKSTGDIQAGGISLQNHTHLEQGDGAPTSKAR